jgi:hypothetical protein
MRWSVRRLLTIESFKKEVRVNLGPVKCIKSHVICDFKTLSSVLFETIRSIIIIIITTTSEPAIYEISRNPYLYAIVLSDISISRRYKCSKALNYSISWSTCR